MNKIAFLCPIYPPHYYYWKKLLKSFYKNHLDQQADLYFIFNDTADAFLFGNYEHKLILPKDLLQKFYAWSTHFPDAKKSFGVHLLKDSYEYLITLDAESRIIKNINLIDMCETYFANKILYWNKLTGKTNAVMQNSLERFTNQEQTDQDLSLYLRFNQPCIYKSAYVDDFFEKTNILNDIDHLKFGWWEYYCFMLYLIFYHGFKTQDLWVLGKYWLCETPETSTLVRSNSDNQIIRDYYLLISTEYIHKFFWLPHIFMYIQEDIKFSWIHKFERIVRKGYTFFWKLLHWMNIYWC